MGKNMDKKTGKQGIGIGVEKERNPPKTSM
jgi:hypothetical protein